MANEIFAYYQSIQDGSELVGHWVQLLYKKLVDGIQDGVYIFDEKKANNALRFIERFVRHNKGVMAPQLLKLEPWERALISCIFGLVDAEGFRQFREIFIVIGRKNGKTLLAAAIAAYIAYAAGEFGSEVYFIAPKRDQSDLVYNAFAFTVDHTPAFSTITKRRKSDLYIKKTNTTIKQISFNAQKSDGFNPMLNVADEMAAWPAASGLKQYEVLTSGDLARREPLTVSITSGGYVSDGPYDELFTRSTRFLMGGSQEQRLLPFLYIIDDPQKWDDINELRKSLPQLGKSISIDTMLDKIATAKSSLSAKAEFLAKFCCLKSNSSTAWLPGLAVQNTAGPALNLADFKDCYCVGGVDLSRSVDLTACTAVIERQGELYVLAQFFLPAAKLEEAIARDGLPYDIYMKRGLLTLSGENMIDYNDCFRWYVDLIEKWHIYPLKIGYDKYNSVYFTKQMEGYGFHMDDVYQGFNLTSPILEFEGTLKDGHIHTGDNDLLRIHLLNAGLKHDTQTDRVKLVKIKQTDHIDGTAALLDAFTVRQKWWEEIGGRLINSGR